MSRRRNYPGSIERRGTAFRIRLCVAGERYYFTLPEVDRKTAEIVARDKYRELQKKAKRRSIGLPGSTNMEELFDFLEQEHLPSLAPNTRTSYGDSLKPLRAFFVSEIGNPKLEEVLPGHVRQYLTWRRFRGPNGESQNEPRSNRTIQRDRAVLHKAFALAVSMEYVDRNPVSVVHAPKPEVRDPVILTDAELERLLAECGHNPVLWLYVLTMAESGARSESEVLWIQWEDIDLEGGFLWIDSSRAGHRTKSGKGRWVPLTSRLREALQDHAATFRLATYDGVRSPWVFHHTTTQRTSVAGSRVQTMRSSVSSAARRANLPPRFTPHDLRHRRVTKWLAEEKNPVHVKEAVGHANLATTMAYTHLAREHLRSLVVEGRRDFAAQSNR